MKNQTNLKKKLLLIFIPILLVLIIVGVVIANVIKNKDDSSVSNNISEQLTSYQTGNVYLLDKQNTLIPLTIKYQQFDSVGEELFHLVSMLKEDSEVCNETFKGVLPSSTTIKSIDLNEGTVTVNFSNEFTSYEPSLELKILESLVWTLTDYQGVESVSILLDDNKLTNMPVNNTPISSTLNKQIGINNYLLTSGILGSNLQRVLSYYEKKIDDNYYYVPVTHYVSNSDELSIYDLTVSSLFTDPGITSSLEVCRCISKTYIVETSVLNDNILYVSLSEDILYDETTVSLEVYQIIKLSTSLLEDVDDVSFLMDFEEVDVNATLDEQESSVSKIELNKFYI